MYKSITRLLLLLFCWCCVCSLTRAEPVNINSNEIPIDLAKQWRSANGDDLAWARPDFDDSTWKTVDLETVWSRKGFTINNGFSWYRLTVTLPWQDAEIARQQQLAVTLTTLEYSSYEVYANGNLIGRYGSLPPNQKLLVGQPVTFPIPIEAINRTGQIVFAVRLSRDPSYTRVMAKLYYLTPGFYFRLGNFNHLAMLVELERKQLLFADIPKLVCACLILMVGLYHLQLFRRRRQLTEYFWFGLVGLASSANIFIFTTWLDTNFNPVTIYAMGMVALYIGNIAWLQFLWLLFGWKFGSLFRLLLALQLLMIVLLIAVPKFVLTGMAQLNLIPLMPLIFIMVVLLPREAWRGNPEARTICFGLLTLVVVRIYQLLGFLTIVPRLNLSHWGFMALIAAIAVSLSNRFSRVYTELDSLNQDLENKVVQRTAELAETVTKLLLSEQQTEEKNQQILDSIRYAEHIQKAMFPSTEQLKLALPEFFILFKPKDIVSGDFYWIRKIDEKLIVAVADCTGHGVPGAFMSMMGNTLLNQIIIERKIFDPSLILQKLNDNICATLIEEGQEGYVEDGMDIGVCAIDLTNKTILFAAAKQSLYYTVAGKKLIEVKGDKRSIGGKQRSLTCQYTNHTIPLDTPITIYLSTDGFTDQNGSDGKKYSKTRLKQFLQTQGNLSLVEQYQALLQDLADHQGAEMQRDDITLVSFKICDSPGQFHENSL